jgi:hypothetical protein
MDNSSTACMITRYGKIRTACNADLTNNRVSCCFMHIFNVERYSILSFTSSFFNTTLTFSSLYKLRLEVAYQARSDSDFLNLLYSKPSSIWIGGMATVADSPISNLQAVAFLMLRYST